MGEEKAGGLWWIKRVIFKIVSSYFRVMRCAIDENLTLVCFVYNRCEKIPDFGLLAFLWENYIFFPSSTYLIYSFPIEKKLEVAFDNYVFSSNIVKVPNSSEYSINSRRLPNSLEYSRSKANRTYHNGRLINLSNDIFCRLVYPTLSMN